MGPRNNPSLRREDNSTYRDFLGVKGNMGLLQTHHHEMLVCHMYNIPVIYRKINRTL